MRDFVPVRKLFGAEKSLLRGGGLQVGAFGCSRWRRCSGYRERFCCRYRRSVCAGFLLARLVEQRFVEKLRRYLAQVPDYAAGFEQLEHVVSDIDFPPEKTVARRGREVVMIVVPSFAERDHREREAVAAVVVGLVAAAAEDVRQRINGEGAVREHHGRNEKAPDEHLAAGRMQAGRVMLEKSAETVHRKAEQNRNQRVETIQKHQLGKFGKVANEPKFGSEVCLRRNPSDVAPDEAMLARRMYVLGLVGTLMMQPMMRRPP